MRISRHSVWSLLFLLFFSHPHFAWSSSSDPDTLLIHKWIDSAWNIRAEKPEISMMLANKILEASHNTYYHGLVNGLQLRGESFYMMGKLDSATFYYKKALRVSSQADDHRENGNNYNSLASIFTDLGNRDSSLFYFRESLSIFEKEKDSSKLTDVYLRIGNVYSDMGQYELAMQSYLQSIRIAEATANQEYLAYNYGSIGGLQDKQHNYADAEKYYQLALDLFIKQNDWYGRMSVYNNMGILYKNEKQYKKALEAYDQCLAVADSMQYGRGKQSAHTNIGILNCLMGNFENGYQHNETGLELATSFGDQESVSDNLNWMARAQMGLQDYTRALKNATQSLEIALQVQSLEKQQDANLTLSEIYQHLHEYALSLDYYKAYTLAKDSLYNLDKLKQIEELQTAYQTEKKDKEIQLLGKNLEINRIRRTRLWVAFGLSILVGGLLIYNQWLRRTRDKKILSQEKQLEIHRRQTAELETEKVSRELDFKKQELAAKALQLARKNEFLQTLQSQVETLPVSSDGSSVDAVRKISRSIRMDIESEEDWDHFLSSFREVHRDYIEQLQQQYPDLTTSEIRLACLMKMNLSGKELAALLNVSADGIKKARYRLRKKLNLDSEIDIQAYLLSFPS